MKIFKKIVFSALIFCLIFSALNFSPAKAAGSSLYLAPAAGTHVIGGTFKISVKVNSGGEEINAAEGSISFDNNLLEVTGVSSGGSIFPFWTVQPVFSNPAGTINFGGGMPPPAYKGNAGHIITITFKAKKSGGAAVRFNSGAVLANDGKGTNVLASMGSASYVISPKVEAPAVDPVRPADNKPKNDTSQTSPAEARVETPEEEYNKPAITSETHEENKWSNKNNIKFKWEMPEEVTGVSIAFDNDPTSDPGPVSDGLFSEKEYKDIEDGVWYLHLKFKDDKKWGSIARFRVMIDTVAPKPFEVRMREIRVGEWPILQFETEDKESGLEKYEIFIGSLEEQEHILTPDAKELQAKDLEAGKHTAIIKAVDKAGNETVSSISFEIEPIPAPKIIDYPREFKESDKFYLSGTAPANSRVNIYFQQDGEFMASTSLMADAEGKWFYFHDENLQNGRYVFWANAENREGIKSNLSEKKTFLVSPPVFATVGSFVLDYFTVFVSLLFMILVIIALITLIVWLLRRKLKKETFEIEDVLHDNLSEYQKYIDQEFAKLKKYEKTAEYGKEKLKTRNRMKKKIQAIEAKIMKEVKDVEKILK